MTSKHPEMTFVHLHDHMSWLVQDEHDDKSQVFLVDVATEQFCVVARSPVCASSSQLRERKWL